MQKLFKNRKVGILIYRNEYAIIAIGKRDMIISMQGKSPQSGNSGGFLFVLFTVH